MIEYKTKSSTETKVYLDGKIVGTIKKTDEGYTYYPKGKKNGGETFPTLDKCMKSLEMPEPEPSKYLYPKHFSHSC